MTAYFPHEQRVVDELADLKERLGKLVRFIFDPVYYTLPKADQLLLLTQRAQMAALSYTLEARIARFPRSGN